LRSDDVVRHTPLILFPLRSFGKKAQHVAINALEVCAVFLGIFESLSAASAPIFGLVYDRRLYSDTV
jgi:hypothetical protein